MKSDLHKDLKRTERLFYSMKTKPAKEAINKLRYLLIVKIHEIDSEGGL